MAITTIRKHIPDFLLILYQKMLRKEYHLITIEELCKVEQRLSMETKILTLRIDSLNQKHVMLKEIIDSLDKKA